MKNKNNLIKSVEKIITTGEGLSNNKAVGIINDDLGNCWVSTFYGLNLIDSNLMVRKNLFFDNLGWGASCSYKPPAARCSH